jgi:5-methylcytosine-specific restriction endonuclease McrA
MRISDSKVCPACKQRRQQARRQRAKSLGIWQTPQWRRTRAIVLARDGHASRECGATPPRAVLTVHHLHYDTPLDLASCITLCRQCHGAKA